MTKAELYARALKEIAAYKKWGITHFLQEFEGDVEEAIRNISTRMPGDQRSYGTYYLSSWATCGKNSISYDALETASKPIKVWFPGERFHTPPALLIPWADVLRYAATGQQKPFQLEMFSEA